VPGVIRRGKNGYRFPMNRRISCATNTRSRLRPVTSRSTPPSVSFRMFDDAVAGVIFSVFAVAVIVIDGETNRLSMDG
jgi:hypothetical protein